MMTGKRVKKTRRRAPYLGEALPLALIALVGILIGYLLGITAEAAEEPPVVYRVIVPPEVREPEPVPTPEPEAQPELVSLGEFKITYYCCEKRPHICGTGDGLTATGVPVEPGICAVDPDVIPLGSTVIVDGTSYLAADVGGAIKGSHIDIAVETHAEALELGVGTAEVFLAEVPAV